MIQARVRRPSPSASLLGERWSSHGLLEVARELTELLHSLEAEGYNVSVAPPLRPSGVPRARLVGRRGAGLPSLSAAPFLIETASCVAVGDRFPPSMVSVRLSCVYLPALEDSALVESFARATSSSTCCERASVCVNRERAPRRRRGPRCPNRSPQPIAFGRVASSPRAALRPAPEAELVAMGCPDCVLCVL